MAQLVGMMSPSAMDATKPIRPVSPPELKTTVVRRFTNDTPASAVAPREGPKSAASACPKDALRRGAGTLSASPDEWAIFPVIHMDYRSRHPGAQCLLITVRSQFSSRPSDVSCLFRQPAGAAAGQCGRGLLGMDSAPTPISIYTSQGGDAGYSMALSNGRTRHETRKHL